MLDVTVLVVARDEERYIIGCLASIVAQLAASDLSCELILIDGGSDDRTVELARDYLERSGVEWRILANERRTLAAGWNIGIRSARGRLVVRPDAHAELETGYIDRGVKELDARPDAVAVGGRMITRTQYPQRRLFAHALSSRVGVGNSPFRTSSESFYTDTAVFAVYRRDALIEVGCLNEALVRHQDNELHARLRNKGWKFFQCGAMTATYYCRDSVRGLTHQMFMVGRYLPDVWFQPAWGGVKARHLAPLAFCASLCGVPLAVSGLEAPGWWAHAIPIAYMLVLTVDAMSGLRRTGDWQRGLTFLIIPLMHLAYGFGTFVGILAQVAGRPKAWLQRTRRAAI